MNRSFVAIVGVLLLSAPGIAGAEPTTPHVTLAKNQSRVMLNVKAGALEITETLTAKTFVLAVGQEADIVQISGDSRGNVSVTREGRVLSVSLPSATPGDADALHALLADSTALGAFDRLMTTEWARQASAARVLASMHALVGALRGADAPARLAVAEMSRVATPRLTLARQVDTGPGACWNLYTKDVLDYTYQLETCLAEAAESWNPLRSAWCGYEYNLKSTLAFFWLLDCSGIPW